MSSVFYAMDANYHCLDLWYWKKHRVRVQIWLYLYPSFLFRSRLLDRVFGTGDSYWSYDDIRFIVFQ